MQLAIYKEDGPSDLLTLPEGVFADLPDRRLLHQVVTIEAANQREPHAHTKNRAAVRGGGRKPWRQKGTGRARASSNRSPLWSGGAITFGPTPERNFTRRLNTLMRRRAFAFALASQIQDQKLCLLEAWPAAHGKTKPLATFLQGLPGRGRRLLLVFQTLAPELVLAGRNIAHLVLAEAQTVRLSDLLVADTVVCDVATFEILLARAIGHAVPLTTETAPAARPASQPSKASQ